MICTVDFTVLVYTLCGWVCNALGYAPHAHPRPSNEDIHCKTCVFPPSASAVRCCRFGIKEEGEVLTGCIAEYNKLYSRRMFEARETVSHEVIMSALMHSLFVSNQMPPEQQEIRAQSGLFSSTCEDLKLSVYISWICQV